MLEVEDLSAAYEPGRLVLNEVDLCLNAGEIVALLGPNGAGKTTFLRCLNGILEPETGCVRVRERDLLEMDADETARHLSYLPQKNESGRTTVFDAVFLGRRPYVGWKPGREDLVKTDAVIRQLGLEDLKLRRTDQLSGGQLQKVCIARAIVQEPLVMLMDEPTASLDLKNQLEIMKTVTRVVNEHEVGAVMSMHDINLALRFADRAVFLKDGEIYGHRETEKVSRETIESVYEVEVEVINRSDGRRVIL